MKIATKDLTRPALDMSWWTRANTRWDNNHGYTSKEQWL